MYKNASLTLHTDAFTIAPLLFLGSLRNGIRLYLHTFSSICNHYEHFWIIVITFTHGIIGMHTCVQHSYRIQYAQHLSLDAFGARIIRALLHSSPTAFNRMQAHTRAFTCICENRRSLSSHSLACA